MKKILISFVLVFIVLLFAGCGKKSVVGTWSTKLGSYNYTYTFNENGTGAYDIEGSKLEFTYTVDKDKITINYDGNTVPFETTFEINGNKLNMKDSLGNDTIYTRK